MTNAVLQRQLHRYLEFVREIQAARLSRRDLMKLGLMSASGAFLARKAFFSAAQAADVAISPRTDPWVEELPIPLVKQPTAQLTPTPGREPVAGEARGFPHEHWDAFVPHKYYELHVTEATHSFHRDLPLSPIWGFDGIFPGPTFHAFYDEPILVRIHNHLPADNHGFGLPEIIAHLHNGHQAWVSDGGPFEWYGSKFIQDADTGFTGKFRKFGGALLPSDGFRDHHYPNVHSGFTRPQFAATRGDQNETLSTLFYHNHRPDFTSPTVYQGLVGFYFLFDPDGHDTGDENDPNPAAFRLPSGPFDIPLLFADKVFDADGRLFFDPFNFNGLIGDKFTVNGKIQPFLRVARRKYRFRLLNGGPARFYEFFLADQNGALFKNESGFSFAQITNDGNFLRNPLNVNSVRLGVAERMDIVVDFSRARLGDEFFLENRLEQLDGRGPTGTVLTRGTQILKFIVDRDPEVPDASRVPGFFYDLPDLQQLVLEAEQNPPRVWRFERGNGAWQINGKFFDPEVDRAFADQGRPIRRDSAEIWVLQNNSGGWMHPIHIHLEEFRILSRNGKAPPPNEISRKDVVNLGHNEEVRLVMRFRDFSGHYPMHCHNMTHEDHAMMLRWDVVPD